ncbi:MAG: hypothetical protein IT287_02045 [Bdellovibrionaceae bacterium]|nr:hypothetical protein [Pseudobdellovibrionaceae bacterium]
MPNVQDKVRYPRIERFDSQVIEEDANASSWAVSYSDFLMTLLCFFVLFFSLDEPGQNSLILKISESFKGATLGSTEHSTPKESKLVSIDNVFSKKLEDLKISVTKDKNSLIVHFPENLFETGKYELDDKNLASIKEVFGNLAKYKSHVNLYFEGHTDDQPLHRQVSSIVLDNYLLGSLRAASALKVAKSLGFEEKDMFIQTTSSHQRNSRTLSIKIQPREAQP